MYMYISSEKNVHIDLWYLCSTFVRRSWTIIGKNLIWWFCDRSPNCQIKALAKISRYVVVCEALLFPLHPQNVVSTHAVQDISYCSQDIEDKRVFAYITKDKSGMSYCHVFMAPSKVTITLEPRVQW